MTDSQQILDALRRLVRYLRLFDATIRSRFGLTAAQLAALHAINRSPFLSVGELAARTSTDQSSASVVASRLVAKGLVRRDHDATEWRKVLLRITEAGEALLRLIASTPMSGELSAAIERIGSSDVRGFGETLELLANALAAENEIAAGDLFDSEC